jgi:hypothetical protein
MATKEFSMNIIFVSPILGGVRADQVQQCSVPRRTIDKVELKIKD